MKNEKSESKESLVSIDIWRDDPSKVRIFIEDRDIIIIPKYYLYEMKNCIDTVLGEECAVCNPEWEGKQPIPLCEEHDEEILGQPLTEGECKKCRAQEEFHYEGGHKFEPQESNKEGEPLQKAFTRANSCLSKKPSMTIGCMECGNNIKI